MRHALAERTVSENQRPSFTQFVYNQQIELAEASSEALHHLKSFVDNQKDPAARLAAAEWLCENEYAMTTAITALTELSFDDNQRVAFKALAELAAVENEQALNALRGIFKWGPTEDVRSRAAKFMKRRLLEEQSDQPLGLPPATPEALSLPKADSPTLPNIFPRMPASAPRSVINDPFQSKNVKNEARPANHLDLAAAAPVGNTHVAAPMPQSAAPKGGELPACGADKRRGQLPSLRL